MESSHEGNGRCNCKAIIVWFHCYNLKLCRIETTFLKNVEKKTILHSIGDASRPLRSQENHGKLFKEKNNTQKRRNLI